MESVAVRQPYFGAEQLVTVPHDQFHACAPDVTVSAGEEELSEPTEQADAPTGSESCGVAPDPAPQESVAVHVGGVPTPPLHEQPL